MSVPVALTIAGSDSGGGAGIQADLKTFAALGVYGASVVTAVTAQSNSRVAGVHHVPPAVVREQIASGFATRPIGAIKTGMLGTRATVDAVADALPPDVPLVIDPVLLASSGGVLLDAVGEPPRVEAVLEAARAVPIRRAHCSLTLPPVGPRAGPIAAHNRSRRWALPLRILALSSSESGTVCIQSTAGGFITKGQSTAKRMWSTPISITQHRSAGLEKKPLVVT